MARGDSHVKRDCHLNLNLWGNFVILSKSMNETKSPTFYIRDIPIYGDAILAPMDGYSDWPFRSLCRELGSAMSYTEFVQVEKILSRSKQPAKKLHFEEVERPITFQLYGDNVDKIIEAALHVQEWGPTIIDINMGCPAKSVSDRGAGVGMMKSPLKIARLFTKLSKKLAVPLTGKIRLGWDRNMNYKLIARIVEECGGSLIAIHGRTKEQSYSGHANWDAIAEVKAAVKIPVIGNGDVKRMEDIEKINFQNSIGKKSLLSKFKKLFVLTSLAVYSSTVTKMAHVCFASMRCNTCSCKLSRAKLANKSSSLCPRANSSRCLIKSIR